MSQPIENSDIEQDPYDFVYDGLPETYRQLKEQRNCAKCRAKRFEYEVPSFCCMSGKTQLTSLEIPYDLLRLFTSQEGFGKKFRHEVRAYNTNLSFASMGVKLDESMRNMTGGVYTFKANGCIYHKLDQLVPRDGEPRYFQLYFYDAQEEISLRLNNRPNLDRPTLQLLVEVITRYNPYAQRFKQLRDLGPLDEYRVTINADVRCDQRTRNQPTSDEVLILTSVLF